MYISKRLRSYVGVVLTIFKRLDFEGVIPNDWQPKRMELRPVPNTDEVVVKADRHPGLCW